MLVLSSVLFLVYLGSLIFLGWKQSKDVNSMESYWMADRNLSDWRIGFCLAASWFGLSSFTGQAGWCYGEGLGALWYLAIPNFAAILLVGIIFVRPIRRIPAISQPEFLEMRYDKSLRPWLALIILLAFAGYAAMEYIALGYVFKNFMGWSPLLGGVIIVVSTMLYVNMGGMNTVVWTEVIQYILLFIVGAIVGVTSLIKGSAFLTAGTSVFSVPHLESGSWWSLFSIGGFMVFTMIVAYWPGWSTEQSPWQRVWMAKDTGHAFRGALYGTVMNMVVYIFTIFMAVGAWAIIGAPNPDQNVEEIVYLLMQKTLPWWVISLAVVGFVAAAMSNISNFSTSAASNITKDWYQRLFRPHASQREMVLVSRVFVAICLGLGIFVAMVIPRILDVLFLSATIATTGYFVPIVGAMFWRRGNTQGAIASLILGGGSDILFYAMQMWGGVTFPIEPVLPALAISLLAYIIVSLMTPPPSTEKLLGFFEQDAQEFINKWKKAGITSTPDEESEKIIKTGLQIRDQGERKLLQIEVKLEGADFSTVELWEGFINELLKNPSWVWLSGYDVLYKIVTKDMLGNPRLARGHAGDDVIIYCEPLKEEVDLIIPYLAVALSDLKTTLKKKHDVAKGVGSGAKPLPV